MAAILAMLAVQTTQAGVAMEDAPPAPSLIAVNSMKMPAKA